METSSSWPWLHAVLTGAGVHFVLAHARRLRAIAEANYKRDEVDAELLARMRMAGLIPEVYPTPPDHREWATLLRHRTALVAQRTACVNRLHSQLHMRGLSLERGRLLTREGRQWLRTTAWPHFDIEQRALVRTHLRIIAGLRPFVKARDHRIKDVAAGIPEARLLMTIAGIGPQRALTICAETLPVSRFPTPGHLASYSGLVRARNNPVCARCATAPSPQAPIGGCAARSSGPSCRMCSTRPTVGSRSTTSRRRRVSAGPRPASPRPASWRARFTRCSAEIHHGRMTRLGVSSSNRMPLDGRFL